MNLNGLSTKIKREMFVNPNNRNKAKISLLEISMTVLTRMINTTTFEKIKNGKNPIFKDLKRHIYK